MPIFHNLIKIVSNIKARFLPEINSPKELRNWTGIYAISNIMSATLFFSWHLSWISSPASSYLVLTSSIIHLLIGARFLSNSQKFGRLAFTKWAWLNLIFVSPLGLVLLYYVLNPKYWILDEVNQNSELLREKILEGKKKVSIPMRQKKLEVKFHQAIVHLRKINSKIADQIFQNVIGITDKTFEELSFFQISTVIALSTMCKQSKQKTFYNLVWGVHWYEDNFFTFGFKNPKPISMYNKYPLTVGAIVLDELNNYRKILEAKMLIKKNLSFSDAKTISLHMGSEYKLFINQ